MQLQLRKWSYKLASVPKPLLWAKFLLEKLSVFCFRKIFQCNAIALFAAFSPLANGGLWFMGSSSSLVTLVCEAPQIQCACTRGLRTGMSCGHSIVYSVVLSCHWFDWVGEESGSIHRLQSEGRIRSPVQGRWDISSENRKDDFTKACYRQMFCFFQVRCLFQIRCLFLTKYLMQMCFQVTLRRYGTYPANPPKISVT